MIAGIKKLIILAIIAAAGWGAYYYFFHEEPVQYGFTTSQITRGDIISTVTATGELNALNVVEVGTQVSGTIQEIYVDFNSQVKAGQLIALIDPSVLQLTLNESQASLAVYQASVTSAQASLRNAERELARNRELYNRKLIAKSTVDTSETDVAVKRAALQEARSRVTQGKAALERARTNLNYTRITSPVNGVVIDRKVDAGQTVAASMQTPTLFKIAKDLTQMQIETKVDEADIGAVKEGQNVTFRVDAFPDETFTGKIVQVRIAPSTTDNVVTYTVIIHISNPELKLKPGMTANVSIETAKAKDVLRIPVAALRFTPPEDLLKTVSFDERIITQKKTLNTGTVWPERNGNLMPPVRVVTGVSDGRFVELVSETPAGTPPARGPRPDSQNSQRPPRPEGTGQRSVLRENIPLVINAQAGVQTQRQSSLFGGPRGGGPRGGGGPR
ncbi:MAG: efflux RND transporter periplasmic adaptor subunit [Synergistaceae bacterium]|nr:efflux RND transporter periplasmic adaptor subunit [Synergistaceae bacterium]